MTNEVKVPRLTQDEQWKKWREDCEAIKEAGRFTIEGEAVHKEIDDEQGSHVEVSVEPDDWYVKGYYMPDLDDAFEQFHGKRVRLTIEVLDEEKSHDNEV